MKLNLLTTQNIATIEKFDLGQRISDSAELRLRLPKYSLFLSHFAYCILQDRHIFVLLTLHPTYPAPCQAHFSAVICFPAYISAILRYKKVRDLCWVYNVTTILFSKISTPRKEKKSAVQDAWLHQLRSFILNASSLFLSLRFARTDDVPNVQRLLIRYDNYAAYETYDKDMQEMSVLTIPPSLSYTVSNKYPFPDLKPNTAN